jgi:Domain of unknown function (DUF4160)
MIAMNLLMFTLSVTTSWAKFWVEPVRLQDSGGFSTSEINRIRKLLDENSEFLLRSWNEYFNG